MRCRYKCRVIGHLKLGTAFPVQGEGIDFEFERDEHGIVTHVVATVSVPDKAMWPTIQPSSQPGVKLHITLTSPFYDLVRRDLRSAEGLLALFGVESIDVENPDRTWLPDNEEEKKELNLFNFSSSRKPIPPDQIQNIPFDLAARSLLAARSSWEIEVPLSFFRKGRCDVKESRYMEAIFDFYFMLESLFAEGKFKSAEVENKFSSNQALLHAIEQSISDPDLLILIARDDRIHQAFLRDYVGKSPIQIVTHIVKLRGFLHHHSRERKDIWHPEDHVRFGADALFLQHLCFGIAYGLAEPLLFSQAVIESCQAVISTQPENKTRNQEGLQ